MKKIEEIKIKRFKTVEMVVEVQNIIKHNK